MIKPKLLFSIKFKCGHTVRGYRVDTEEKAEWMKQLILHKFNGLCGECYEKYCKENNKKPWWEK